MEKLDWIFALFLTCIIVAIGGTWIAPPQPTAAQAQTMQITKNPPTPRPVAPAENTECTILYNTARRFANEGDAIPSDPTQRDLRYSVSNTDLRQAKYLGSAAYSALYQACKLKWGETPSER